MRRTLRSIRIYNMQSIRDYTFEFPDSGLVRFLGDNSNGKSITTKLLDDIVNNKFSNNKERKSMVNWDCKWGEVEFTDNIGNSLLAHVHHEAAQTYFELNRPGEPKLTRYLSDKSYSEFPKMFGFHFDAVSGVSLSLCDSDESLLFFKTKHKGINSLLQSATRDEYADTRHTELVRVKDETRAIKQLQKKDMETSIRIRDSLKIYDIDKEKERYAKLVSMYNALRRLEPLGELPEIKPPVNIDPIIIQDIELPEIKPVPNVQLLSVRALKLPRLSYPAIVDCFDTELPDILQVANDIRILESGKCPTCGKLYIEKWEFCNET